MASDINSVYDEWSATVNMSASELESWAEDDCSRRASEDPEEVIERNLRLLETDKSDWSETDLEDAERAISFISRMNSESQRPENPEEGAGDCPSNWVVSLRNWAYDPLG